MDSRELPRRGRSLPVPFPPVNASPPPPPRQRGRLPKYRFPSDPPPTPTPTPTPTPKARDTSTTPPSSTSTPDKTVNDSNKSREAPKSNFQKTVCLADWWLVKSELGSKGKRLAVAGLTSREQQAVRVFSSAPIHKRYDVFTLETTDGICVIIKGFMNKARTVENGFPSEVCNHFIFGFPPYWEEYADKCMAENFPSENVSEHILMKLSPQPETVAGTGDSRNNISEQDEKFVCEEARLDSLNRDLRLMLTSKEDKMEIKSILKSRKRKYSAVSSSQKPSSGTDDYLFGLDTSSASSIGPGCPKKKSSSRDCTIENAKTLDISGNCLVQQLSNMVEFAKGKSSSEGILGHSEAGVSYSTRKLVKKQEDYQMSLRTSRYGKIGLNSFSVVGSEKAEHSIANVNCELGSRTNLHFAAVGLKVSTDETNSSELDADSVDKFGHKIMDKEYPSEDTVQRSLALRKLSPRLETVVGEEAHVNSHWRDLGLIQDKMDFEGMLESTQTESLTVLSPQISNKVVKDAKNKLHVIDTSSAFPISSGGPEKESSFGDHVIENPRTLEMSENYLGNRIKALASSMLGQKIAASTIVYKDANSSRNHEIRDYHSSKMIEDHTERNPISACHLNKKSRCKNAFDNQKLVKLDEHLSNKTSFSEDISSSEEVLNHADGRALTRSMRNLERKWKDDKLSLRISDDGEISSEFVSVVGFGKAKSDIASADGEPGARNSLNFAANGCKEPTDATNSESYVNQPKFDQKAKPSIQDKDCRAFITKASTKNGKNRAKSSTRSAAPDNGRKNNAIGSLNNISKNAKASRTEAKRKLTYVSKLFINIYTLILRP
ncbi:Hypothetical predicted protein [Olea europaea subsp. europaea]|uniref:SANTA domain-containing protein n=1 Tax=Olea europaea subsp. europaea TaxID=158383 RepID=A0A8S0UVF8_OLEEU|nr:Hypothetical predicted protein [Olea europaea subsp. europaea]